MDEEKESKVKKRKPEDKNKGHALIIFAICLSIFILILGFIFNKDKSAYISDSYVSGAAFVMLIVTAIMQNKDLNLQREEMSKTREEFEKQTEEQEKLNMLNKENSNLNSFFELIRLKDEKHKELIYIFDGDEKNSLTKFLDCYVTNVYYNLKYEEDFPNLSDSYKKEYINGSITKNLKNIKGYGGIESIKELYNILKTIQLLVIGNKEDDSIFRKDWIDDENNLGMIFHSLLTKSERALVLFLDNQLLPDDFIDDMYF